MQEIEQLKAPPPWWIAPLTGDVRYLAYCRMYALACAVRLMLPDAMAGNWLLPALLHWLGAALLAVNGCALGWILCAVGAAVPILFLEDQLSQSGYLLTCALVALACIAGCRAGRARRLEHTLPWGIRLVTLALYALAGLHKLNRDYLDPAVSCANGGLGLLFEGLYGGALPPPVAAALASPVWPLLHLAVELGLVVVLAFRPALGVLMALAMHLPLTIVFAPAFVFIAASGWVCFFRPAELIALGRTLRRRWPAVLAGGAVAAGLSMAAFFPGRWTSDPDWRIKEIVVWLAFAWLLEAITTRRRASSLFRMGPEPWPSGARGRVFALAALYIANGLTPYLGLQLHHTAAMLSNLRIDEGCFNSLVFPESLRGDDPYVRIERVVFQPHRVPAGYAARVEARLWGPETLYRERQRWCLAHREPLPIELTYRGRRFVVDDLCAADGWPLAAPLLPGLRRFQLNLERSCPQPCVH